MKLFIKRVRAVYVIRIFVLISFLVVGLSWGPIIKDEIWYFIKEKRGQTFNLSTNSKSSSPFAKYVTSQAVSIVPVNTDFSLVIEKIGLSVPIVADVPTSDANAYTKALKEGVAHAASSPYPSENPGNVYIFAHSSINFWDLGKYATSFNLLRKLKPNDKVHVFYDGKDYKYNVIGTEVVSGWNITPLTRAVIEPILTLQTCDPPGTTLNRLVVTSKLEKITDAL